MKKIAKLSLLALSVITFNLQAAPSAVTPIQKQTYQLLGYFTNWDIYGRNYTPDKIPIQNISGVIYAFAEIGNCAPPYATDANPALCNVGSYATGVQDYKLYSTDPYADFTVVPQGYNLSGSNGRGTINQIIELAHQNKKPAILSIGGYSLSVALTTAMEPNHRQVFIQSIIDFLKQVKSLNHQDGFDGVDVDWEPDWPENDWQNHSQDIENYVNFIHELRQALKTNYEPYAWLTIAVPADPIKISAIGSNNWKAIANDVDYLNVMSYDYHGGFDSPKITDFHSPLNFDPNQPHSISHYQTFNTASTIEAYLQQGISSHQLLLGFPTYGRAVAGVANQAIIINGQAYPGLYQAFTSTPSGEWNDGSGSYDYQYIVNHMLTSGFTKYNLDTIGVFAYNPSTTYWISYDNVSMIHLKANYVQNNQLGGMMTWELSGDIQKNGSFI